jgi:pSer/pThr/pTyr-binding forkhead associated (FHA) protein
VNARRLEEPDSPAPPADLSDRVFMVDRSPILIGRDGPGLDIPIHGDPYVSRRHAEIVWMGAGWGVRDLGSTNGTRINGEAVEGSEVRSLGPEDVLEVGFFTQLTVRDLLGGER